VDGVRPGSAWTPTRTTLPRVRDPAREPLVDHAASIAIGTRASGLKTTTVADRRARALGAALMWGKGFAAVAVLASTGLGLAGLPAAADHGGANGPGHPLEGDLDGDGVSDRATLQPNGPLACDVVVELGDGEGGYGAPTTYSYPVPTPSDPYCPDMGVVVDLGGDGATELVLAWFYGRPEGSDVDLLVLRDYTPAEGFAAMYVPSGIGVADFDGDGLQDVFEVTDEGEGFRTYLNTPDGVLVPGPVQVCSDDGYPGWRLADFDLDGATDVVASFANSPFAGCYGGAENGVVVVLDDGSEVLLQQDSEIGWSATVVDVNEDGIPDVQTADLGTGQVTNFVGNGDGTFDSLSRRQ
jgi:hypothetical protein